MGKHTLVNDLSETSKKLVKQGVAETLARHHYMGGRGKCGPGCCAQAVTDWLFGDGAADVLASLRVQEQLEESYTLGWRESADQSWPSLRNGDTRTLAGYDLKKRCGRGDQHAAHVWDGGQAALLCGGEGDETVG